MVAATEDVEDGISALGRSFRVVGVQVVYGVENLTHCNAFWQAPEDDPCRFHSAVKVGDKSGLVEHLGLRVLTLRDSDGSVHMIPNGTIATVTNMTKDFSYAVLQLGVSYHADVDAAIAVLSEVGAELRRDPQFAPDLLEDLEVIGVDDFTESRVQIALHVKTVPSKQWRVGRELRRRIKKAFDAHGIEFL